MTLNETGPLERDPETQSLLTIRQQDRQQGTVFTRSSSSLSDHLDAHATEHVDQMVADGWIPIVAADAWQDYAEGIVQAAADGAVAEGSWEAS